MKHPHTPLVGEARLLRFADGQDQAEVIATPKPDGKERVNNTPEPRTLLDIQREWDDIQARILRLELRFRDDPEKKEEARKWLKKFKEEQTRIMSKDSSGRRSVMKDNPREAVRSSIETWKKLRSEHLEPWMQQFEDEARLDHDVDSQTKNARQIMEDYRKNVIPQAEAVLQKLTPGNRELFNRQWKELQAAMPKTEIVVGETTGARAERKTSLAWSVLKEEMLDLIEQYKNSSNELEKVRKGLRNARGVSSTEREEKKEPIVKPETLTSPSATGPEAPAPPAQAETKIPPTDTKPPSSAEARISPAEETEPPEMENSEQSEASELQRSIDALLQKGREKDAEAARSVEPDRAEPPSLPPFPAATDPFSKPSPAAPAPPTSEPATVPQEPAAASAPDDAEKDLVNRVDACLKDSEFNEAYTFDATSGLLDLKGNPLFLKTSLAEGVREVHGTLNLSDANASLPKSLKLIEGKLYSLERPIGGVQEVRGDCHLFHTTIPSGFTVTGTLKLEAPRAADYSGILPHVLPKNLKVHELYVVNLLHTQEGAAFDVVTIYVDLVESEAIRKLDDAVINDLVTKLDGYCKATAGKVTLSEVSGEQLTALLEQARNTGVDEETLNRMEQKLVAGKPAEPAPKPPTELPADRPAEKAEPPGADAPPSSEMNEGLSAAAMELGTALGMKVTCKVFRAEHQQEMESLIAELKTKSEEIKESNGEAITELTLWDVGNLMDVDDPFAQPIKIPYQDSDSINILLFESDGKKTPYSSADEIFKLFSEVKERKNIMDQINSDIEKSGIPDCTCSTSLTLAQYKTIQEKLPAILAAVPREGYDDFKIQISKPDTITYLVQSVFGEGHTLVINPTDENLKDSILRELEPIKKVPKAEMPAQPASAPETKETPEDVMNENEVKKEENIRVLLDIVKNNLRADRTSIYAALRAIDTILAWRNTPVRDPNQMFDGFRPHEIRDFISQARAKVRNFYSYPEQDDLEKALDTLTEIWESTRISKPITVNTEGKLTLEEAEGVTVKRAADETYVIEFSDEWSQRESQPRSNAVQADALIRTEIAGRVLYDFLNHGQLVARIRIFRPDVAQLQLRGSDGKMTLSSPFHKGNPHISKAYFLQDYDEMHDGKEETKEEWIALREKYWGVKIDPADVYYEENPQPTYIKFHNGYADKWVWKPKRNKEATQ